MIRNDRNNLVQQFIDWFEQHENATDEQIAQTGYVDGIDLSFANLDVDQGAYREQTIEMAPDDADIFARLADWWVQGQGIYADEELSVHFVSYGAGNRVVVRIDFPETHVEWPGFEQERTEE